ncbi:MAG TPA: hypothetical protein VD969_21840 [Symbiobacteriaceae bacterium]|nr:hypothetical protein [Symbiobacteriaceae bacterium]
MGQQLLAARNALLGTTNLLVLAVPEGWRLLDGYAQPEVDSWSEYRDRRWMRHGQGVYRLVEPHPEQRGLVRCEVELSVSTTDVMTLAMGGEPVDIGEHGGVCFHGQVPKGWLGRRTVPAITVEWACPQTQRLVRLVVNGLQQAPVERTVLRRLMDGLLAGVQCH